MRDGGLRTTRAPCGTHGADGRDIGSRLATIDVMSEFEAAWDEVHAANTLGWQVGRPYLHDERDRWEQYAFDPWERPSGGMRSREWIAVGTTEVGCLSEMARCLQELREGRWPR
jgi:hypothetical protein